MSPWEQKVLNLVKKIPPGQITTYKILAEKLGRQGLARVVGNALSKNPELIRVPCHRVIKSSGRLGGYALGLAKKKSLLQNEGVKIVGDRVENFKNYLYLA